MEIHAAAFITALLIASAVLTGITGLLLILLRFSSAFDTNPNISKYLRRYLTISIVFGVLVLILCGVWYITGIDDVVYGTLAVFFGQFYFFIQPAISWRLLP